MAAFAELGVMPEIVRATDEMGWMLPTPIQSEAIPLVLGGGDVMGAAETGSGKTGAFGIPVLQIVLESLQAGDGGDDDAESPAAAAPAPKRQTPTVILNDDDKGAFMQVKGDGLSCQCPSDKAWAGIRATVGVKQGAYCFEVHVRGNGVCRVGWSTSAAALDLGTDQNGFGYGGTGRKSNNRSFESYGEAYGDGDVIGCYLDIGAKSIYFTKNGADLGQAFSIPPFLLKGAAFFPSVCLKNCGADVRFAEKKFKHAPFEGYDFLTDPKKGQTQAVMSGGAGGAGGSGGAGGASVGGHPIAIVIEPARDLAEQTWECMEGFRRYIPQINSMLFVGGADPRAGIKALKQGCHIAVGTPGRLMDMIESGKMKLNKVKFFVLDEADRLLETGNLEVIMKIFNKLPKASTGAQRLQTLMFSATLHSPEITSLASKICQNPTWVDLKGKDAVPETVHHLIVRVDAAKDQAWGDTSIKVPTDKVHARDKWGKGDPSIESRSEGIKRLKCMYLLKLLDSLKIDQCLIFCRTNLDCDNLEAFLISQGGGSTFRGKAEKGKENRYSCVVMAGWRSNDERRANLQHFKDGDVRFLICTDVAARGIDINGLPYVINMTLPDVPENYIHRIGRVGRQDALGLAISFVATEKEKVWFHKCANKGRGCDNTRLVDKGGCTIWYDEPGLLKDVENRLGKSIEEMPRTFELSKDLAAIKFGANRAAASQAASEHVVALRPTVQQLSAIEKQAQDFFLSLRGRQWGQSVDC